MEKEKNEGKRELINSKELINQKDYQNLLNELKSIIKKGKSNIYKAVDNILVETRRQIGERIVREELKYQDKADYGEYLSKNLAIDLKTNKQRLSEIVRSLTGQLSRTHYVKLIELFGNSE